MTEVFEADYHEKEEGWPIVYNLRRLSLEWNMVEQFFTALIWHMLGDYKIGMAVTGGLGNQSRTDIVLGLIQQHQNAASLKPHFEFACKAFNILRENRNILMHSHTIVPTDTGSVHWRRATGRGPTGHLTSEVSFDDLETMIQSIVNLGLFAIELIGMLEADKKNEDFTPKMEPFPMPLRILQVCEQEK